MFSCVRRWALFGSLPIFQVPGWVDVVHYFSEILNDDHDHDNYNFET